MAASFPQHSQEPLEELINNLKVDDASILVGSASDVASSCISSGNGDGDGEVGVNLKESGGDNESFMADQTVLLMPNTPNASYYTYFGATFGGMKEHPYYISGDSTELHYPVMRGDNGSLIYLMPGTQPGYNPYSHYVPVAMVGVDGHVSQPYPLNPMSQLYMATPGYAQTPVLVQSPYLYNPGACGIGYDGMPGSLGFKPTLSSKSHIGAPPSKNSFSDSPKLKSSLRTLDASSGHDMNNQTKAMGKSDVQVRGDYPFNQGKGGVHYATIPHEANATDWSNDKLKTRNQISNISNFNVLNEQNDGSYTTGEKDSFIFGGNAAGSLATGGNGNSNSLTPVNGRDRYNLPDFSTKYNHAFFFVIKSYSEDDVHKSIKYNVWASTPNGNKRLDTAYQDAQEKIAGRGSNCPVFLFFSVNASGQFCGVAEMIGRVDFNKKMDFWQQDKWNGCFPVKWHIIKDIPNPQLRHIIVENNENKPVTNSRDTQEVRYAQGIEMLNIFKNYVSRTSILDDFEFYESRQKVMLDKRHRLLNSHLEHKQKQKTGGVITEESKVGEKQKT